MNNLKNDNANIFKGLDLISLEKTLNMPSDFYFIKSNRVVEFMFLFTHLNQGEIIKEELELCDLKVSLEEASMIAKVITHSQIRILNKDIFTYDFYADFVKKQFGESELALRKTLIQQFMTSDIMLYKQYKKDDLTNKKTVIYQDLFLGFEARRDEFESYFKMWMNNGLKKNLKKLSSKIEFAFSTLTPLETRILKPIKSGLDLYEFNRFFGFKCEIYFIKAFYYAADRLASRIELFYIDMNEDELFEALNSNFEAHFEDFYSEIEEDIETQIFNYIKEFDYEIIEKYNDLVKYL